MCKPSCCNNSDAGGAGLAAVVVLIVAVFLAVKVAPAIVEIGRVILDVIRIAAVSLASAVVLAAIAWLVVRLAQCVISKRRQLSKGTSAVRSPAFVPISEQTCLACGDKGRVVRVFGNGAVAARPCPECQPAQLAG